MQVWNSASLPVGQIRVGDKMDKTLRHGANDMFLANDADWVPSGEDLTPDLTSDSWTATAGGGWSTAADWSSKAVPNASTTATIAATGTYTVTVTTPDVAASLLINDAGARVADTGTLTLGGALNITAGKFALESGGSLVVEPFPPAQQVFFRCRAGCWMVRCIGARCRSARHSRFLSWAG